MKLTDGEGGALLFHVQTDRTVGHGVLRPAQEEPTDHLPPYLSSRDNAGLQLDRMQIPSEWTRYPAGCYQRVRPRHHVHVLHALVDRTAHEQISLVEKTFDVAAADPIQYHCLAQPSNTLQRLRLSKANRIFTGIERNRFYLYVWVLLRT